jgi:hypothetical protein
MASEYPEPTIDTPWRYLNNGGYGGSLALMLEFVDKYIGKLPMQANCQLETMQAFIKAKKDGFPIELDYGCELFQTIAFDPAKPPKGKKIDKASYSIHQDMNGKPKYTGTDFMIRKGKVVNKLTKSTPAILHGNGTTPMQWIYQL